MDSIHIFDEISNGINSRKEKFTITFKYIHKEKVDEYLEMVQPKYEILDKTLWSKKYDEIDEISYDFVKDDEYGMIVNKKF